jgi:DNA-binding NtrC family response regulator
MHNTPQILLVDDDAALLQALPQALSLRVNTIHVDTCDSAFEALEQIQNHDYDAIVSDIKMPGMDGLALLEKIQELRPETPTLLITGHGEHNLAIQALRGGAYDFIQKPIDREYVVVALERAIQTHQLRRQVKEHQRALELHAQSRGGRGQTPGASATFGRSDYCSVSLGLVARFRSLCSGQEEYHVSSNVRRTGSEHKRVDLQASCDSSVPFHITPSHEHR